MAELETDILMLERLMKVVPSYKQSNIQTPTDVSVQVELLQITFSSSILGGQYFPNIEIDDCHCKEGRLIRS